MDKVTYSSDTTAALPSGAHLTVASLGIAAAGNSTAGYFGGGTPSPNSIMDKITYSSDTTAQVPGANLSAARAYLAAVSGRDNDFTAAPSSPAVRFIDGALASPNLGYFGGGFPGPVTTVDKTSFANDTTARAS